MRARGVRSASGVKSVAGQRDGFFGDRRGVVRCGLVEFALTVEGELDEAGSGEDLVRDGVENRVSGLGAYTLILGAALVLFKDPLEC